MWYLKSRYWKLYSTPCRFLYGHVPTMPMIQIMFMLGYRFGSQLGYYLDIRVSCKIISYIIFCFLFFCFWFIYRMAWFLCLIYAKLRDVLHLWRVYLGIQFIPSTLLCIMIIPGKSSLLLHRAHVFGMLVVLENGE